MRLPKLLAVAVLSIVSSLSAQTARDPELVKGIRQVEDGYLDDAVTTLESVARRLTSQPAQTHELADAYLYLGIAHAQLDSEKAARASFREALKLNPSVRLDAARWPPKVSRVFSVAEQEARAMSAPVPSERVGVPASGEPRVPLDGAVVRRIQDALVQVLRGGVPLRRRVYR